VILAAFCALGLAGCKASASPKYEFLVRVESDPNVPLAGAQLARHGQPLGTSDKKGLIALSIAGVPGETVELDTTCPKGHRAPERPLAITLRALAEEGKRPEYRVSCAPLVRTLVVAVRAENGPHLPVKYLGKEIARTDDAGAAHALLHVSPGDTLTITLDTSGAEAEHLLPKNPELRLTAQERDDVVLFDQTFTREHERKPKTKHTVSKGPIKM
jgi:hypothetical protein